MVWYLFKNRDNFAFITLFFPELVTQTRHFSSKMSTDCIFTYFNDESYFSVQI
jgi:hypothetical protein